MNVTIFFIVICVLLCLSIVIATIPAYHIRDHWWTWGYFFRVTLGIRKRKKREEGATK